MVDDRRVSTVVSKRTNEVDRDDRVMPMFEKGKSSEVVVICDSDEGFQLQDTMVFI